MRGRGKTLTRLAALGTLSRGAGEGLCNPKLLSRGAGEEWVRVSARHYEEQQGDAADGDAVPGEDAEAVAADKADEGAHDE